MTNGRIHLDLWLRRNAMPSVDAPKDEKRAYFDSMPEKVKREWEIKKATEHCNNDPTMNASTAVRAQKRMARLDAMNPDLRAVVYDFNLEVVQVFLDCGVKNPKHIRHLIDTVLGNEFPNGQPRFKLNKGPNAKRNPIEYADDYWSAKK